jgi:DNA-binding MarR family transcriptional regulator
MTLLESTQTELLQRAIDCFWETFPPVWNSIRSNVRGLAAERFDITVEQFHILRHIRKGAGSVSELAAVKQISRPAISQSVDQLVEKGLLTRRQISKDRRYIHLELTPDGDALLNALFQQNRRWMMEKMAALSPEEINSLVQALNLLHRTFIEPKD